MNNISVRGGSLALMPLAIVYAPRVAALPQNPAGSLAGTSWQLVKFVGGDDKVLAPDDKSKYAIAFDSNGSVSVRIDCNRGHGAWSSPGPNQLQFGAMALTRAMCPPAPLNDRLAKDWQYIRSYTIKEGDLFLSLTVDGGTYEFEPIRPEPTPADIKGSTSALGQSLPGLPATFVGTLPCADCPSIRYQVDLYPDHTFSSRMTYEGRAATFDSHGRWALSGGGTMVMLQSEGKTTDEFALKDANTLRKLDSEGKEIDSKLNYDLRRAPEFTSVTGAGDAPLEHTSWKLSELNGKPISSSLQREAYFVLEPESHRVSGSGGCNRLISSYQVDGEQLKFGQMAGTMMACPNGMEVERAFLQALGQVNAWKVVGQSLELFDGNGKLLARFEVR